TTFRLKYDIRSHSAAAPCSHFTKIISITKYGIRSRSAAARRSHSQHFAKIRDPLSQCYSSALTLYKNYWHNEIRDPLSKCCSSALTLTTFRQNTRSVLIVPQLRAPTTSLQRSRCPTIDQGISEKERSSNKPTQSGTKSTCTKIDTTCAKCSLVIKIKRHVIQALWGNGEMHQSPKNHNSKNKVKATIQNKER